MDNKASVGSEQAERGCCDCLQTNCNNQDPETSNRRGRQGVGTEVSSEYVKMKSEGGREPY
jgi:hypothetical protein